MSETFLYSPFYSTAESIQSAIESAWKVPDQGIGEECFSLGNPYDHQVFPLIDRAFRLTRCFGWPSAGGVMTQIGSRV